MVHGWGRNAGRMLPYIEKLHPQGYNLLVFDARNHGNSDKDRFSSMPKFAEDIHAAINFAEKELTYSSIGIIGLSIGGAASIYAASMDSQIKSVVTVGAFANPKEIMMKPYWTGTFPIFLLFGCYLFTFRK